VGHHGGVFPTENTNLKNTKKNLTDVSMIIEQENLTTKIKNFYWDWKICVLFDQI